GDRSNWFYPMLMGLIVGVSRNSHHHALTTQTEYAHKYQVGMHMHLLDPPTRWSTPSAAPAPPGLPLPG
ncbi:MAG: hypothetical protein ACKO63_08840, partial [Nodosilinea sp.]